MDWMITDEWLKLTEKEMEELYMAILKQDTTHWTRKSAYGVIDESNDEMANRRAQIGPLRMQADHNPMLDEVRVTVRKDRGMGIGGHDPTLVCAEPEDETLTRGEDAINAYYEANPNGTLKDALAAAYKAMVKDQRVIWDAVNRSFRQRNGI